MKVTLLYSLNGETFLGTLVAVPEEATRGHVLQPFNKSRIQVLKYFHVGCDEKITMSSNDSGAWWLQAGTICRSNSSFTHNPLLISQRTIPSSLCLVRPCCRACPTFTVVLPVSLDAFGHPDMSLLPTPCLAITSIYSHFPRSTLWSFCLNICFQRIGSL